MDFISTETFKNKLFQKAKWDKKTFCSIEIESLFFNLLKNKNETINDCVGASLYLRDVLRRKYNDKIISLYDAYQVVYEITLKISRRSDIAFELADSFLEAYLKVDMKEAIISYIYYLKIFMKGNR